jgi:hypothetical protein
LIRSTNKDRKFLDLFPKIARQSFHLAKDEEQFKDELRIGSGVRQISGNKSGDELSL